MRKAYVVRLFFVFYIIAAFFWFRYSNTVTETKESFSLTDEERIYLSSLKTEPLVIAYSYDLVFFEEVGGSSGILQPILDVLMKEFGLVIEMRKLDWTEAFAQVKSGEIDFYGPIAISESRRQSFITTEPFYRSYSKIVSPVDDPVDSMPGLYNQTIGLLSGSVISRTMQTYLGPEGSIVYLPSMDEMITALAEKRIDAFATVDNAEFEILLCEDIQFEFTIDNFYVDQGFISGREDLRKLAELISRYIEANENVRDEIVELRHQAIVKNSQELFADEINYLRKNNEFVFYADTSLYPLCYLEDGEIKGMQLEINSIFEQLTGVKIRIGTDEEFPDGFASAGEKIKTGECAAIVGEYYNIDTREDHGVEYSKALWMDTLRIYSYKDVEGNLIGKTVGTTQNALDYVGWSNTTGNIPVIYKNLSTLIKALKKGETDVVFMGETAFDYGYSVQGDYSLREVTGISAKATMHMLYGAQNIEFNTLYNRAISLFQILNPRSVGIWESQINIYKSEYIRMRYSEQIRTTAIIAGFIVMLAALVFLLWLNRKEHKKTKSVLKIIKEKDVLTGIYNRGYMDENLDRIIKSVSRADGSLSVFMVDIDYFKKYNDNYGHGKGDDCLRAVANKLNESVKRTDDFVARYGGEEFAIILPYTDETGARVIGQRLLENIRSLKIPHEKSKCSEFVTISLGVTSAKADFNQTAADYLKRADEALYVSKNEGRDRFTFLELENEEAKEE